MSAEKKRKLLLEGDDRVRGLIGAITAWGAGGMSRYQAQVMAVAFDEQVNNPSLNDDQFKAAFKNAWAIVREAINEEPFQDLHTVEARDVEFLVDPLIPRATITMLDGHPGQGKSLITTHLATQITRGGRFAERYDLRKGRVLFMAPEDDADRILRPRLEVQGANLRKIRFMAHPMYLNDFGRELLRKELIDHRPELVVIDPLPPFVDPDTSTYKATEVRKFMQPLAALASEMDVAILLVRHLRKGGSEFAIEAGQGSMDFIATVRSALMAFAHPVDPDTKVLAHTKSNWAAPGKSLTFGIERSANSRMPVIEWLAEIDDTADQLMRGLKADRAEDRAKNRIMDLLEAGPMKGSQIFDRLISEGFGKRTIERARDNTPEIQCGKGPNAMWKLSVK